MLIQEANSAANEEATTSFIDAAAATASGASWGQRALNFSNANSSSKSNQVQFDSIVDSGKMNTSSLGLIDKFSNNTGQKTGQPDEDGTGTPPSEEPSLGNAKDDYARQKDLDDVITYRGIYLPTLTNRFKEKKLE